ncbi:MAG: hypothetical protein HYY18_12775 [Planctomycetes bacterium]|nr:hypothetical protein [Planctomycetota bacterium]
MKSLLAGLACLLILSACGKKEETTTPGTPSGTSAKEDFSSAEAAMKTMIAACTAKDKALVGKCFAKECEGEFKSIKDGSAKDGMWNDLFEMFSVAKIAKVDAPAGSKTAKIDITMKNPKNGEEEKETINMVQEGADWKIQGF